MKLLLQRIKSDTATTLGVLWRDGFSECFTAEDGHHDVKIKGETRIPAGTYPIRPRTEGGMIQRYKKRFSWHKGMLHLQDVPGFQYVYIHVGNDEKDTEGCILVGRSADRQDMTVRSSARAYEALYEAVYVAAEAGELEITIEDMDRFGRMP